MRNIQIFVCHLCTGTMLIAPHCSDVSTDAAKLLYIKFDIMCCIFNFYYILTCPQQNSFSV